VENAWRRFAAEMERDEPTSRQFWTLEIFREWWGNGKCEYCGGGLSEYQTGGHRMDRIDNDAPHIPSNCRRACWPCNATKADKHPEVFRSEMRNWLVEYGPGRVPWAKLSPRFRRAEIPNVEQFRSDPQGRLFSEDVS